MRIASGCEWVMDRLFRRRPFFTVRVNDGEMICMYRTKPEGALLGTDANPAYVHHDMGDAYNLMLAEMASDGKGPMVDVLLGCCYHADPEHPLNRQFWAGMQEMGLDRWQWAGGHWPLDGVVDGSAIRMVDLLRRLSRTGTDVVLVTCNRLADAVACMGAVHVAAPDADSWTGREWVYETCREFADTAENGPVFVWAGGGGLKPTAWRLWREFPQTSHIDAGHLFNGAFGLADYGWLQRRDGPWYEPYFTSFGPYVRSFIQ